jgi:hypothetical protein
LGPAPAALAIVAQDCTCGARAVPEDVERTPAGLVAAGAAADGGESLEAVAAVDRLGGDQEATVRSALAPQGVSKTVRTHAASDGWGAWERMRLRVPSVVWRSTAADVTSQDAAAVTSTQVRAVGHASRPGAAGGAPQRFVRSFGQRPRRLATRDVGRTAVNATA